MKRIITPKTPNPKKQSEIKVVFMQPELLDVVFRSRKRSDLLLLLGEEARTIEEIKTILDVSPTAILPQIKRLTDSSLVVQRDGYYELTGLGEEVVKKVRPLVDVLTLLERNDYWLEHDLNGIPQYLQDRLGDLKDFRLIEPDPCQIFEPRTEIVNFISASSHLMVFSSFFRPEFLPIYSKLGRKGAKVSLILTESVLEKTLHNYERKLKKFTDMPNTELFVCNDGVKLAELIVSDQGVLVSLFASNGRFHHDHAFCSGPQALDWAKELFEFYKSRSRLIKNSRGMESFSCTSGAGFLSESPLISLH